MNFATMPDPARKRVRFHLGEAQSNLKNYPEAVKAYREEIQRNPKDVEAFIRLSAALFRMGHYQDAKKSGEKAVRLDADSAEAHYQLGLASLKLKEKSVAMEQYWVLGNLDKELAGDLIDQIEPDQPHDMEPGDPVVSFPGKNINR